MVTDSTGGPIPLEVVIMIQHIIVVAVVHRPVPAVVVIVCWGCRRDAACAADGHIDRVQRVSHGVVVSRCATVAGHAAIALVVPRETRVEVVAWVRRLAALGAPGCQQDAPVRRFALALEDTAMVGPLDHLQRVILVQDLALVQAVFLRGTGVAQLTRIRALAGLIPFPRRKPRSITLTSVRPILLIHTEVERVVFRQTSIVVAKTHVLGRFARLVVWGCDPTPTFALTSIRPIGKGGQALVKSIDSHRTRITHSTHVSFQDASLLTNDVGVVGIVAFAIVTAIPVVDASIVTTLAGDVHAWVAETWIRY